MFMRLLHSLPPFCVKTFFGVANCLDGIFLKMGGKLLFHRQTISEMALTNSCEEERRDIKMRVPYCNLFNNVFTLLHKDHICNIFRISL